MNATTKLIKELYCNQRKNLEQNHFYKKQKFLNEGRLIDEVGKCVENNLNIETLKKRYADFKDMFNDNNVLNTKDALRKFLPISSTLERFIGKEDFTKNTPREEEYISEFVWFLYFSEIVKVLEKRLEALGLDPEVVYDEQ
jgi:hypothetical protein